jgi:hypothetical protein
VATTLPIVAELLQVPVPKVKVQVVSHEAGRKKLLEGFHHDYPGESLARLGEAFIAIGLAQDGTDLAAIAPPYYAEHFSGFFDEDDHTLYLVADEPMEHQRLIIAHELAHAVLDARIDLGKQVKARQGDEDSGLALMAAVEGQAQAVSVEVMKRLVPLGKGNEDVSEHAVEIAVASANELAESAPTPWLGLQLAFPYDAGAKFFAARKAAGDPLGLALFQRLPVSTAQVLEPALYANDVKPLPAKLELQPLIPKSARPWSTVLGRAQLDLLGKQLGVRDLGKGWRGDRIVSVQLAGKPVIAWAVDFDTPAQADRFVGALAPETHLQRAAVNGTTVVAVSGVPNAQLDAVLKAGLSAFRPISGVESHPR